MVKLVMRGQYERRKTVSLDPRKISSYIGILVPSIRKSNSVCTDTMSVTSPPKCSEEMAVVSEYQHRLQGSSRQPLPAPHCIAHGMLTRFLSWRLKCHCLILWLVKSNICRWQSLRLRAAQPRPARNPSLYIAARRRTSTTLMFFEYCFSRK